MGELQKSLLYSEYNLTLQQIVNSLSDSIVLAQGYAESLDENQVQKNAKLLSQTARQLKKSLDRQAITVHKAQLLLRLISRSKSPKIRVFMLEDILVELQYKWQRKHRLPLIQADRELLRSVLELLQFLQPNSRAIKLAFRRRGGYLSIRISNISLSWLRSRDSLDGLLLYHCCVMAKEAGGQLDLSQHRLHNVYLRLPVAAQMQITLQ